MLNYIIPVLEILILNCHKLTLLTQEKDLS